MATKKKTKKKNTVAYAIASIHAASRPRKKAGKKKARRKVGENLGTLGRKNSGTSKSHKPLAVLEKRLVRLSAIVAKRQKSPKAWA